MTTSSDTRFRYPNTQKVAYTATAGITALPIGEHIYGVRLWPSTDIHYKIGSLTELTASPATSNDIPLASKQMDFPLVTPGQYISFVRQASDGTVWVTECTQ